MIETTARRQQQHNETAAVATVTVRTGLGGDSENEMTETTARQKQQHRQDGSGRDGDGANWNLWRRRQQDDRDDN